MSYYEQPEPFPNFCGPAIFCRAAPGRRRQHLGRSVALRLRPCAGWWVRPQGGGTYNAWHDGDLDGTFSYTVRLANGFCWAVIFNRRDVVGDVPNYYNIDSEMNNAVSSVTTWPTNDLFDANGDGANNFNEFVNLTDPTNSTSVEKLQANPDPHNSQNLVLGWLAARGRLYTLETATDLLPSNWQGLAGETDIVGDNTMRLITNSVSGTSFYRLRARLQRP